ncbi:hypothetical protein DORLON_00145 [Dorea longicatena DSM 13814]|uniref:Uncharacterized protein n=1 Tax=Dorea longicatena DSM 13814 TaxID=411462 RepID=A6BCY3_9FIRM|nr:hypothetical protein DORLON_00145 [Dorea longicatena DSM 13814]
MGMIRMFKDMAAPTPVRMMAMIRKRILPGKLPEKESG